MNHRPQQLKTILSGLAMIFALVFFIQITQAPAKDTQPNLAVGLVHTTAPKSNATLMAVEENRFGQNNVSSISTF